MRDDDRPEGTIRSALPSDAPAIARIHVESWRAAYAGLLPPEVIESLDAGARERQWRDWLGSDEPSLRISLAEISGDAAGFLAAGAASDDDIDATATAEVHCLYVAPCAWGRGVGRALLREVLADLSEAAWHDVVLWSLEGNERAARFYAAAGFVAEARRRRPLRGLSPRHVRWRLALAQR